MEYGLSSEMPPDDVRQVPWAMQREERGFDSTELWNLDLTLARFMLPRLKAFHELIKDSPEKEHIENVEAMIAAFEILKNDAVRWNMTEEHAKTVHKGLMCLANNIYSLWL